jgi:hypothetical protein
MLDRTPPAPPLQIGRPNRSALSRPGMGWIRNFDVVLMLIATPGLLLVGVPVAGYGIGLATWIGLRAVSLAFGQSTSRPSHTLQQISLGLGYRLTRVLLLAGAIILARKVGGKHDGLAALLVILVAFTIQLTVSIVDRPASHHS